MMMEMVDIYDGGHGGHLCLHNTCTPAITLTRGVGIGTDTYIHSFGKEIQDNKITDDFYKPYDDDLFQNNKVRNIEVLKDIKVVDILNVVDSGDFHALKCYMYVLFMLNYLYIETTLLSEELDNYDESMYKINLIFKKCLNLINQSIDIDINKELSDVLDDDIRILLENIYKSRSLIMNSLLDCNDDVNEICTKDFTDCPDSMDSDKFDTAFEYLNNSKIGELAKEISQDIDLSKINIEQPGDLFNLESMMSGNSGALGDIITKVGTRISDKIQKGELQQDDLMKEAFSMMSKLNGNGSFMDTMMKQMNNSMDDFGNTTRNTKQAQLRRRLKDKQNNKS